MAILFVMNGNDYTGSASSDSNDGLDPAGFDLTGATFTNGTKKLNETGKFAGYTWQAGDLIYISGGTGVTTGLYEIAGKDSNDQIELVDDIGGTNPTDVTSSDGPLATLEGADGAYTAGDTIRLCADAVYGITSEFSHDTSSGTSNSTWTYWVGVNSRGVEDGSQVTIRADASLTTMWHGRANVSNQSIKNVVLDGNGNATNGFWPNSGNSLEWHFENVEVFDVSGHCDYVRARRVYLNCTFRDAGDGILGSSGGGGITMSNCKIHDMSDDGIAFEKYDIVLNGCEIYACIGDGISHTATTTQLGVVVVGCTIHNCNNGIISTCNMVCVRNTTISGCAGYALSSTDEPALLSWDFNHTYDNDSGDFDFTPTRGVGLNNITGDPLFTNTAPGSEDFTPKIGSPLLAAGQTAGSA